MPTMWSLRCDGTKHCSARKSVTLSSVSEKEEEEEEEEAEAAP